MTRTRPSSRPAFSLVEVVVSMLIIGTMFAAGAWSVGVAARDRRAQADLQRGHDLCRALMAEVLSQRYTDPNGAAGVASGATRALWNDIGDYDALSESPPTTKAGAAIGGAAGWRRAVSVTYQSVNSSTLALAASATDTGLRRISITATSPRGVPTTLTACRSSSGPADRPTPGAGLVTWLGASLTVGPELRPVTAGAELLNTPSP